MTDKDLGDLGVAAGDIIDRAFTLGYETGRNYIPAGGMALTAERMENVRAAREELRGYRNFTGYGRSHVNRLIAAVDALFPATEPAEDAKPCGSNSVTLGWCKLTARHEGLHTNGTYLWGTPSEPDPPAPAEPAEEETKAERDSQGIIRINGGRIVALSRDPRELVQQWYDLAEPGSKWQRDYAAALDLFDREAASSPVVPAPTETGPWEDISEAPKHLTLIDRVGDKWTYDGDNWVTPETAILPVLYINRKFAPFVAAEEG